MKKHHLLALVTLTTLLTSCLGPRMNKWVEKKYGESLHTPSKKLPDYLTVTSPLITANVKAANIETQVKHVLPLLFYWQFDYANTCTLNPKIPVNAFRTAVQSYANSKGLKQKLNGQRIELSVDEIPNIFVLNDRNHLICIGIYAFSWDKVTFRPDNQEMVVSYKIIKDNVETGKGVLTIPNTNKVVALRFLQSLKKATGNYLDRYNECITAMSKVAVDKIVADVSGESPVVVK